MTSAANNEAALAAAADAASAFPSIAQPSLVNHCINTASRSYHQVDGPPLVTFGMQGSRTPLLIVLEFDILPYSLHVVSRCPAPEGFDGSIPGGYSPCSLGFVVQPSLAGHFRELPCPQRSLVYPSHPHGGFPPIPPPQSCRVHGGFPPLPVCNGGHHFPSTRSIASMAYKGTGFPFTRPVVFPHTPILVGPSPHFVGLSGDSLAHEDPLFLLGL